MDQTIKNISRKEFASTAADGKVSFDLLQTGALLRIADPLEGIRDNLKTGSTLPYSVGAKLDKVVGRLNSLQNQMEEVQDVIGKQKPSVRPVRGFTKTQKQ